MINCFSGTADYSLENGVLKFSNISGEGFNFPAHGIEYEITDNDTLILHKTESFSRVFEKIMAKE